MPGRYGADEPSRVQPVRMVSPDLPRVVEKRAAGRFHQGMKPYRIFGADFTPLNDTTTWRIFSVAGELTPNAVSAVGQERQYFVGLPFPLGEQLHEFKIYYKKVVTGDTLTLTLRSVLQDYSGTLTHLTLNPAQSSTMTSEIADLEIHIEEGRIYTLQLTMNNSLVDGDTIVGAIDLS